MTFDYFEGPAGTGKTHSLIDRARELVEADLLDGERRLLALTYMNGARRRLEAKLGADTVFRRRYDCMTFDVFARTIAGRRRSLIVPAQNVEAEGLNEFDAPCFLAAALLGNPAVREWVSRTYPLILVDEAQDLNEHRLGILRDSLRRAAL